MVAGGTCRTDFRLGAVAVVIFETVNGKEMWLKSMSPTVTWGPREQARTYRTKGDAVRAIAQMNPADLNRHRRAERRLRSLGQFARQLTTRASCSPKLTLP